MKRDTAAESVGSRRRVVRTRLGGTCGAILASQVVIVALMPSGLRWITVGLFATTTIMALTVVALEISFRRAAARFSEAVLRIVEVRGPLERLSPLVQRAYYMARRGWPASFIAGSCDIPEAFAALIIDDVRRSGPRRGDRPKRWSFRAG
jgi:hypothetical protein